LGHKGTFKVSYFIEQGDRKKEIDPRTSTIVLGEYKGDINLVVEFTNLTLGLNDTYTKVRNSEHDKVFFLKGYRVPIDTEAYHSLGIDTVSISAQKGHYGEQIGAIRYRIVAPDKKRNVPFQINTLIVNGVSDRTWKSKTISKAYTLVPKPIVVKDTIKPIVTPTENPVTTVRSSREQERFYSRTDTSKDTIAPEVAIEEKLWEKLQEQLLKNNKEAVIEHAKIYRMNCSNGIFTSCTHAEDALYYILAMQENILPTNPLLLAYRQEYPQGKYTTQITEWLAVKPPELRPVICDIAQIQVDHKALVIGEIKGGEPPYYVNFYDDKKNNSYPIKSIRFTESNTCIMLSDLEISEGNYRISITDNHGQFYTEKKGIYIKEPIEIPKTVSLSGVLLCLFGIGLGYKKYIHF